MLKLVTAFACKEESDTAAFKELDTQQVINLLKEDLGKLSTCIKSKNFSALGNPSASQLKDSLSQIYEFSASLAKASEEEQMHRLLRQFTFIN